MLLNHLVFAYYCQLLCFHVLNAVDEGSIKVIKNIFLQPSQKSMNSQFKTTLVLYNRKPTPKRAKVHKTLITEALVIITVWKGGIYFFKFIYLFIF